MLILFNMRVKEMVSQMEKWKIKFRIHPPGGLHWARRKLFNLVCYKMYLVNTNAVFSTNLDQKVALVLLGCVFLDRSPLLRQHRRELAVLARMF